MKQVFLILGVLVLLVGLTSFAQAKVIASSSFEESHTPWKKIIWGSLVGDAVIDSTISHNGDKSGKITVHSYTDGGVGGQTIRIPVDDNKIFKLSTWTKAEYSGIKKQPYQLLVRFYDKNGKEITRQYSQYVKSAQYNWKKVSMNFGTPPGTKSIDVVLMSRANVKCGEQPAKIWFDDVKLEQIH